MKKQLRQKLALSRETLTALAEATGGVVLSNNDCSSDCFAVTNRDNVC